MHGPFILSEACFFSDSSFPFFSAFFPAGILEGLWVIGQTFEPWDIPFMNTLILLLSGTTVTWAHYAIGQNDQRSSVTALGITVLFGIAFTVFQAYEYHHAAFKLTDGIYAANFYLAIGFRGLHVIIGTIF